MRGRLLVLVSVLVAATVGCVLYFGQDDEAELDAAAGAECHDHALARAFADGLLDEFHQAQGWRVNGITHGHVDPAAKTGKLYVVSGELSIRDLSTRTTRRSFVCRLELTEQDDWRLLELVLP